MTEATSQLMADLLPALRRAMDAELAPSDAARVARSMGLEAGAAFHSALDEAARRELDHPLDQGEPEDFWRLLSQLTAGLGWGELRYEELHPGVASVEATDWAEARERADARYPVCHFTTGLLAELLSRVAGTDLAVLETDCRAMGAQHCRFLVGSPIALQSVYEAMQRGTTTSDAIAAL